MAMTNKTLESQGSMKECKAEMPDMKTLQVLGQSMAHNPDADRTAAVLLSKSWTFADDTQCESNWSCVRLHLHSFFCSGVYEWTLALLLALNMIVVVYEVDAEAQEVDSAQAVQVINLMYTVIWLTEMLGKVYVFRLTMFSSPASFFEFSIVVVDCLAYSVAGSSAVSVLRVFRLARLARTLRLMTLFPELALLLKGLVGALNAVFWGCLFMMLTLLVWSIIFVVAVHPVNKLIDYDGCTRCPVAFASVGSAFLTLTQTVVVGDSWGTLALPLIEAHTWVALPMAGVFSSVALTLMNLILAVICDGAERARQLSDRELAEQRKKELEVIGADLMALCTKMDKDKSGNLTLDELMDAFDKEGEFHATLMSFDMQRSDLQALFTVMDRDRSGFVDYEEFVEQMTLVKHQDSGTLLYVVKHYISECYLKLLQVEHFAHEQFRTLLTNTDVKREGILLDSQGSRLDYQSVPEVPLQQEQPLRLSQHREASCFAENAEKFLKHFEEVSMLMKALVDDSQDPSPGVRGGSQLNDECGRL